jgi:uroporphyrinogen-III synthase
MNHPAVQVILTRPDPDNVPWVKALAEQGVAVRAWPLIDILPMPDASARLRPAWASLHECRAVMFVSRPAVQHFFARRPAGLAWPPNTRAWCTGPGTRRALLDQGLLPDAIDTPPPDTAWDTEHLWPVVQNQLASGDQVLFVRGTDALISAVPNPIANAPDQVAQTGIGRDWLARQVAAQGAQLRWAVSYQRACPSWSPQHIGQAQSAAADGSVWVFSSAQALRHLQALLPGQSWAQANALATHDRIADFARDLGFVQVRVCQPSAQAVLASLESFT